MEVQALMCTSSPDNQKVQIISTMQHQENHLRLDYLILSVRKDDNFIDFYLINPLIIMHNIIIHVNDKNKSNNSTHLRTHLLNINL